MLASAWQHLHEGFPTYLFISNVMLSSSNDMRILDTLNGLSHGNTSEHWIGGETLPVSATLWDTADGPSHGTQLGINTLSSVLSTHGLATRLHQSGAPCGRNVHAGRESRVHISYAKLAAAAAAAAAIAIAIAIAYRDSEEEKGPIELTITDTERRVLQAETSEVQTRNVTGVTHTGLAFPSDTGGEVDLLEEGQLAHKGDGLLVGVLPAIGAGLGPG